MVTYIWSNCTVSSLWKESKQVCWGRLSLLRTTQWRQGELFSLDISWSEGSETWISTQDRQQLESWKPKNRCSWGTTVGKGCGRNACAVALNCDNIYNNFIWNGKLHMNIQGINSSSTIILFHLCVKDLNFDKVSSHQILVASDDCLVISLQFLVNPWKCDEKWC